MKSLAMWVIVECVCRVLGIATATVLGAVGAETLRQSEFTSLAIYLLFSSVVIMLFEVAFFIDALLTKFLICPPTWKIFVFWKKMAKVGGFQKFLYYTMMSVMCFLHPVLVWHAVIPGTMLIITGFCNFILSKNKKSDLPKESSSSCDEQAVSSVYVAGKGNTEQTFSFFHVFSGARASFFPSNSRLQGPTDSVNGGLSMLGLNRENGQAGRRRSVHFIESFQQDDAELEESQEVEAEETTSDKAPMIRL